MDRQNRSVDLFGEDFVVDEKDPYNQFKLRTDEEMVQFLKQFIRLEEEPMTPYKHKLAYYNKKAHYINGKKVNRYVYAYVKKWLETH